MGALVLVVEDDHGLAELVCDALRDGGFDVERASTDLEAYRRISALPTIEAVVLDVNLGKGTTGYDVGRFARQVIPDLAVVYMSGEVGTPSYRAFAVPDSLFLEKPFEMDELVSALTRRLSRNRFVEISAIH